MLRRVKAYLLRRLCGLPRTQRLDKSTLNSFILLRYDRIGDLIISLPLAKALKLKYPMSNLAIIASQSNAPVAHESGLFSEIYIKPINKLKWIWQLWSLRGKFDVVVDLNHSVAPHSIFATLIMRPKHVASPYKEGRWGVPGNQLGLFDIMPSDKSLSFKRPIAEIYLDIARLLECPLESCFPYPLPIPKFADNSHFSILLNHEGSGEGKSLKDLDLVAITELAGRLDPNIRIIMTPMERSYANLRALFQSTKNLEIKPPQETVKETMAIAAQVDLVITPDTSLVHLACAYSKPLIAIYASHNEFYEHWKPLNLAPTTVLFSSHEKKLDGYSSDELIAACSNMIRRLIKQKSKFG